MKETLWVVGGEQRLSFHQLREWEQYKKAIVVRIENGAPRRVLEYESPPEHCPESRPSHVFKAATFQGDTAYLCTQTEVLVCDVPGFAIRKVISLPCFNDLHHVVPGPDGNLLVAVTGLDAVAEVSPEGELVRITSVLGGSPWVRFSPDVDYRKVPTTKPHQSHPNHLFYVDGRPWVTRFEQRDAVPVDGSSNGHSAFPLGTTGVHDGHVEGHLLRFTGVDGCLITFDLRTGRKTVLDLNGLQVDKDDERPLGWCRGLLSQNGRAWVGFSRIRYTRLRQNLSWLCHGFRESEHYRQHPTRVALYDLESPALLREIDLEPVGLGAVFSVHPG